MIWSGSSPGLGSNHAKGSSLPSSRGSGGCGGDKAGRGGASASQAPGTLGGGGVASAAWHQQAHTMKDRAFTRIRLDSCCSPSLHIHNVDGSTINHDGPLDLRNLPGWQAVAPGGSQNSSIWRQAVGSMQHERSTIARRHSRAAH